MKKNKKHTSKEDLKKKEKNAKNLGIFLVVALILIIFGIFLVVGIGYTIYKNNRYQNYLTPIFEESIESNQTSSYNLSTCSSCNQ